MTKSRSVCAIALSVTILAFGCGAVTENPNATPSPNAAESVGQQPAGRPQENEGMTATTACYNVETGGNTVLRSQTFAMDFEPFRNSCFVTSHDPEFKDPPLGAEIAVFKDGKKVEAFYHRDVTVYEDGKDTGRSAKRTSSELLGATCWVEAVSFQDVSDDGLTDAIVAAKCGVKDGVQSDNRIYLNNSKFFVTSAGANAHLSELGTIKEIVDFARRNPQLFSLIVDVPDSNSQP